MPTVSKIFLNVHIMSVMVTNVYLISINVNLQNQTTINKVSLIFRAGSPCHGSLVKSAVGSTSRAWPLFSQHSSGRLGTAAKT